MPGQQDATITSLHPAEENSDFTADTVKAGAPFDVVATVEIGRNLMNVISRETLTVTVLNLSQGVALPKRTLAQNVAATDNNQPRRAVLRVKIPGGWTGVDGDVLQVVASYKATAGALTDYSTAQTDTFIAAA